VAPDIYCVISAPNVQAPIFNWTYLRCYWRYLVNSMSVTLQTRCQIQSTNTSLHNVNSGPEDIQCIYCSAYSGWNIQLHDSALLLEISPQFNVRYTAILVANKGTLSPLRYVNSGHVHTQCNYSYVYSDVNVQVNLSALRLEIYRQCNPRYTAYFVWNTPHIVQFTLCELWSRTYTT
jgi:hypothetical protein